MSEIAFHFQITPEVAERCIKSYESRINSGEVVVGDLDRSFWTDVRREAEGDTKVTFVSQKGFHHAWKSELRRLDGASLLEIYEASKDFLGTDVNSKFLDFPRPKGYDPLMLDREVRNALEVVSGLLDQKLKENKSNRGRSRK